jgi:hypothetical protein
MIQPPRLSRLKAKGNDIRQRSQAPVFLPLVIEPDGLRARARKDIAMTGKDAPPEVKIRSYRDSPICDVVVVVHGTEMEYR